MEGVERELNLRKKDKCEECDGSGAEDGEMETCLACNGSGQVRKAVRTPFGSFMQVGACSECAGLGEIPKNICKECDGTGIKETPRKIKVNIPAGVDNGSRLRVSNEGEYGGQGNFGDLYIEIEVEDSEIFRREGNDLYLNLPITFVQAALGSEIKVPTLNKDITIKIHAGTQSGTNVRLRGEGAPEVNGHGSGDLYVVLDVITPTKLTKEQKTLFEKLSKFDEKKSLLDRIKDWAKR